MNNDKHIWEGWTVQDFIDDLNVIFEYQTFKNETEVKEWCMSSQPYYKKNIPEVTDYFIDKYREKPNGARYLLGK